MKDTIKTVNSVIKSLDAAKKIAAASEKAAATEIIPITIATRVSVNVKPKFLFLP